MPVISRPARITSTSATLIDNIFINCVQYNYKSAIVYSDISDHLVVMLHLEAIMPQKSENKNVFKRNFDPKSIEKFTEYLLNSNWDYVYDKLTPNSDPSLAYDNFLTLHADAFDKFFPEQKFKKPHRITPRHDWMTKGLVKSCILKSKLYRNFCKKRTEERKKNMLIIAIN